MTMENFNSWQCSSWQRITVALHLVKLRLDTAQLKLKMYSGKFTIKN